MVLVTRTNFLKESNDLIQKLPSAAYVSLDLELTGIHIPTVPRPSKFDQPFERYAQLKHSPERYSIVQIGICVFEENPDWRKFVKRSAAASSNGNGNGGSINNGVDNNVENEIINLDDIHIDNDDDNIEDEIGNDVQININDNYENEHQNENEIEQDQLGQRLLNLMPHDPTRIPIPIPLHNHDNQNHDNNNQGSSDDESVSCSSSSSSSASSTFNSDNDNENDDNDNEHDDNDNGNNEHDDNDDDEQEHEDANNDNNDPNQSDSDSDHEHHNGQRRQHIINHHNNENNDPAVQPPAPPNQNHDPIPIPRRPPQPPRNIARPPRHHPRPRPHQHPRARTTRNEPPEFLIHKYNFLIFPSSDSPREVVMNPKSVQYLNHSQSTSSSSLSSRGMFSLTGGAGGLGGVGGLGGGHHHFQHQHQHRDSFNWEEWIKHGIPYETLDMAQEHLKGFQEEYFMGSSDGHGNGDAGGHGDDHESMEAQGNVTTSATSTAAARSTTTTTSTTLESENAQGWEDPTDPADIAFIARAMANLREWIDSAAGNRGGLDDNGYPLSLSDNLTLVQEQRLGIVKILPQTKKDSLKRCLRGKIENEYPALHWDMNDCNEVLVRLNDDEKRIRDARRKKFAWQKMQEEKIGFTRVFKALSDACSGVLGDTGGLDEEYNSFLEKAGMTMNSMNMHVSVNNSNGKDMNRECDWMANDSNHVNDVNHQEKKEGTLLTTQSNHKRRRIPMVVHNGFLDFLFLMTHFQTHKLPPTYEEAKNLVRHYFPLMYDTKVLATEFTDFSIRSKHNSLVELHQRYVRGDGVPDIDEVIEQLRLDHIPRSIIVNCGHVLSSREAGDDAVMIGTLFQCLCRRIKWGCDAFIGNIDNANNSNDAKRRKLFKAVVAAKKSRVGSLLFLDESLPESKLSAPIYGLNKVFLSQSIFTVDMEAVHDHLKPGYTTSAIFKVSHPNKLISLSEINSIIKGIRDPEIIGRQSQKIHYEIGLTSKWFIVAARSKVPRGADGNDPLLIADIAATLDRRGELLKAALYQNFTDCQIQSLEETMISSNGTWSGTKQKKRRRRQSDDLDEMAGASNVVKKGIFSRLLGSFRVVRKDDAPRNKRTRLVA